MSPAASAAAKQAELVPAETPAPATAAPENGLAVVIERLALNPDVDVLKLEKIIELQERVMKHQAAAAFNAAYSKMQASIPEINERGQIIVKGSLRSTYARLEDIHEVIKPILRDHGFAIRHRTEWPEDKKGIIRIVGILSHEMGHSEESCFEAPADKSEFRSDIQSQGSTVSYGRRYTTLDLLNIATRGADNDGQRKPPTQTAPPEVKAPAGFEEWWLDMRAVAEEGLEKLEAAWTNSKTEHRRHLLAVNRQGWESLKRTAAGISDAARKRAQR